MATTEELFEYISQATDKVYTEQGFNGYSTQEEREELYQAVTDALIESEYEHHMLDDLTAEQFEELYDMMENENFHSENSALCVVMHNAGLEHSYIDATMQYDAFLFEN